MPLRVQRMGFVRDGMRTWFKIGKETTGMSKSYSQTEPYIPTTDAAFKSWLQNFAQKIQLDPQKYSLAPADAQVIMDHYQAYAAAFDTVQFPDTRNSTTIGEKDAIRASAEASVRVYAQQIKLNKGLDNKLKLALGVHVDDPTRSPIPAPESSPLLMIVSAFSGVHHIRYADENTPASRKKPHGAKQLELWAHIGPNATANPDDAKYIGSFTKNPILNQLDPSAANMIATYFARWQTARGLIGPWSLPVAMTVAFGGPVDQQMWYPGGTPKQQPTYEGGADEMKIAA